MQLSQRLTQAAQMVTIGNRLADIGTDHGFVPICLIEQGNVPSAIAMDVNEGPLLRAKEHIAQHGLEEKIDVRLSDGLSALIQGEADTVLIAGMGGALTVRILENGKKVLPTIRELVLQPQSEVSKVRRFLENNGWKIDREKMVLEDGKYYQMMQCHPGLMHLTDEEAEYGPCLMKEKSSVWISWLQWQLSILDETLRQLESAENERVHARRTQVLKKEETIRRLLSNDS